MIIGVKFKNNPKQYAFNCYEELQVGDLVVVDTQYGFSIGEVSELNITISNNLPLGELREVVNKVDTTAFFERKARAERMKELKKKMDKRVKELQNIAVYEVLAKEDPDLADMLAEFKSLG